VGNVQGLALSATGSRLYLAGHFGTARLQQQACGRNLRGLLMVDPVNGVIDCSWIPQVEPWGSNYTGVWSMLRTGTHLWVDAAMWVPSDQPHEWPLWYRLLTKDPGGSTAAEGITGSSRSRIGGAKAVSWTWPTGSSGSCATLGLGTPCG
jgi:hypothetical protein